jgi:lipid A ethanolaminephosphotransferase
LFFSLVFVNYKNVSLIGRKNHKINTQIIPTYTISSMKNVVKKYYASKRVFKIHDANPKHDGLADKEIMILVVGETARADHFNLGGYKKETNPRLKKEGIKFYNNVTSCGTLTAYSVPCMFYLDKYEDYSPSKAKYQQNVLDLIQSTKGHHVWWLENNSSCKNVCERVNVLDYYKKTQKEYNPNQQDGFLIGETGKILEQYKNDRDDVLIVLHTIGSHGPKYYKRYPKEFETFKPTCATESPEKCDREHLVNTYDNTIVYTDYVLSELIHLLKKYDGPKTKLGLLYVSDHGESLGEKNVYLHGLPKMLAPKAQTHVPMIEWTNEFKNNEPEIIDTALTHEHLPKMLIDFFSIKTSLRKG